MHARWLVDIAMLYVRQWPDVLATRSGFASAATHAYWARSRQRFEYWQESLSLHRSQIDSVGASKRIELWQAIRPTLEEIFLSDMLTRILATTARTLERLDVDDDASPIAHSVFTGHEDIRNRCLRLMMLPGLPVDQAVELNRIRHSLEHWTDRFLASLATTTELASEKTETITEATKYAFRPDVVSEFIEEKRESEIYLLRGEPTPLVVDSTTESMHLKSESTQSLEIRILSTSCERWIAKHCRSLSSNPHDNRLIGEAALAMVRPDRSSEWSPLVSCSVARIASLLDQTDQWVSQLLVTSRSDALRTVPK